MKNKNEEWTRETGELDKKKLVGELKDIGVSAENIDWVSKELDRLINEKVEEIKNKKL
jgi:hypothetical protein